MKRRVLFRENSDEAELINLTPLLDVLFLILVFFILIAPLLDFDRLQLAASSDNIQELSALNDSSQIKIYVQKDNSLWLGTHSISFSDLKIALSQYYLGNPHEIPQLYQDKDASFGTYQKIKNLVESIGFEELDVVLKTE